MPGPESNSADLFASLNRTVKVNQKLKLLIFRYSDKISFTKGLFLRTGCEAAQEKEQ